MSRRWTVRYGSEQLPHRHVRRLVRRLLRRGAEPEPRYRTGKYWAD